MTQQLTLSSLSVAPNNTDKAITSAANSKDNAAFASELDRRLNEPQRSDKDKPARNDLKTDNKQAEANTKAEKPDAKDGKELPPEKSEKVDKTEKTADNSELESDKAPTKEIIVETDGKTDKTESEDESDPLMILAVTPVTEKKTEKQQLATTPLINIPQSGDKDMKKSVLAMQSKSNNADFSATSIRADILQAIQKQNVEGDAVTTEKVKLMMQTAGKTPEQFMTASAETISAMRQLDPQAERSSASKLSSPLVFSTIPGMTTSVAGTPSVANPALSLDIQPQLNSAAWGKVMSSRVVWMAREGVQQAELRLNPANLGPVEVRLSMQNDQANVTFIASNAAARDALEQALPRLRESFNESGLALNNAEVSHQDQPSQGSEQDEQLHGGNNIAQVIVETDDMDNEATQLSVDSPDNSVGVSVFA
ncbi:MULTISPECIES: flagellar hook-length control protein FliK [unclassified Methylophaga]|jgi:flagellar hook-length control protein FliK|uniref:flagellar hook-length control protein FliK n=2 Tax=Methylophaga TaxID=40222 RepID=UPI0025E33808|nr:MULTISPECIES: flagellar hook-length control protein FliK [unclassified Methylophaga]MDX1749592.1 flagellar hook-length control protein FliK [Methylophaga sp.]|tara:strand:- start:19014 stop:20285 length:1272 start_codon:yes stop_codon:yes gene_type:complete